MSLKLGAKCLTILFLLAITGCASPATYEGMTVQTSDIGKPNPKLLGAIQIVNISGGKDTNPLWTSQVGTTEFRKALETSLSNAGYLATNGSTARYSCSAILQSLDQPLIGLDLNVKSTVTYTLNGDGSSTNFPVTAAGIGTFSDSPFGVARLRIANEKSIQENIKFFLSQLQYFPTP